jgi:hypothetical protein
MDRLSATAVFPDVGRTLSGPPEQTGSNHSIVQKSQMTIVRTAQRRIERMPQLALTCLPDCPARPSRGTLRQEVHMVNGVSIKLIQRIREEFEEAPWLRFTVGEAAQFWGLDPEACELVFANLITEGFLGSGIDDRFGPCFAGALDGCLETSHDASQLHG